MRRTSFPGFITVGLYAPRTVFVECASTTAVAQPETDAKQEVPAVIRAIALFVCIALISGCGPYRIKYLQPSNAAPPAQTFEVLTGHSHGIGPFLIGGGGYFFLFQSMSPALIDYTGEIDTRTVCPQGYNAISEVQHYHNFGQSALAALIS